MIAEESTSWPGVTRPTSSGGLGFGLKWNMGWMNDTLQYIQEEPMYRQYHHNELTFSFVYAFSENFVLPISHDEVVHGKGSLLRKMPGDHWQKLANVRRLPRVHVGAPRQAAALHGQRVRPAVASGPRGASLDWWLLDQPRTTGCTRLVGELNRVYREHPALWQLDSQPAGFRWIDADDNTGNLLSYLRFAQADQQGDVVATVVNYSGDDKAWVRVGRATSRTLGGRARHQRVRRGQYPEPGRVGARGRGVAVARPAVLRDRAGRGARHAVPRPRRG